MRLHPEIKKLLPEGWCAAPTRGGHIRLVGPENRPVFCAATPSDHRAFQNIRREIRRVQREHQTNPPNPQK